MTDISHILIFSSDVGLIESLSVGARSSDLWEIAGTIDRHSVETLNSACEGADVLLIDGPDLVWLTGKRPDFVFAKRLSPHLVAIVCDEELLEIVALRVPSLGFLMRTWGGYPSLDALTLVLEGYLSANAQLFDLMTDDVERKAIIDNFEEDEQSVFALLGEGLTNPEIVIRTGLAAGRVKQIVQSLTQKLRLKNRTPVAILAKKNGSA